MTGRINHITADQPLRLACPEAGFAYQTDSEFFLNPGTARGPRLLDVVSFVETMSVF